MQIRWLRLGSAVLFLAVTLCVPARLAGQTITIFYVAPTATINASFGGGDATDMPAGYLAARITATTLAAFNNNTITPPNVRRTYAALQSGTALRTRLDRMLQISGGKVDVDLYLIDDRNFLSADAAGENPNSGMFVPVKNAAGQWYVWPAAAVWPAGARYRAQIGLGENASQLIQSPPRSWTTWEATIVHETLHTQFVGESTKWGSIDIVYGGDRQHWKSELCGEQELPLEEGLGTFFGATHDDPFGMNDITAFFRRTNERYQIESRSFLAGTAGVWNAPHIEQAGLMSRLPPAERTGSYVIRSYKWKDVPAFYLPFSESTSTAFHGFFWRKVNNNPDQALNFIFESSKALSADRRKRYLTYVANRLALQMEAFAATPDGISARSAGTLTSSMFPFALLDILTHFDMTEAEYRAEYGRNYADRDPRAFTEYWGRRAAVRALVQPHLNSNPIRIEEAVDAAHRYFQQADTILTPGP